MISSCVGRRLLSVALVLFCCIPAGFGQLLVDRTKPLVYIEYDHSGHLDPPRKDDGDQGLWLRLVNNSSQSLVVRAFDLGVSKAAVGLNFSVIPTPQGRLWLNAHPSEILPKGYSSETGSIVTISSHESLLFTVPKRDVTENWYIETSMWFDLPRSKFGENPRLVVDFTSEQIPAQFR